MKKSFLFLSDFDGTMSVEDYYTSFAAGPLKELDISLRNKYINREITSFEYLNTILMKINLSETDIQKTIDDLPIDPSVAPLISTVHENGGEFAVISAGADYYIRPILNKLRADIPLFANRGVFSNNGIEMQFPAEEQFHSSMYGIAKERVVEHLEDEYETVFFAGDGSADFRAAKAADVRFAKARLAQRLDEDNCSYIPFNDFSDILDYLKKWLSRN